jgi:hypothetical protein
MDYDGRYLGLLGTYLQEVRYGGMDRIDVTQDRDRRRAVVNVAMNIRDP